MNLFLICQNSACRIVLDLRENGRDLPCAKTLFCGVSRVWRPTLEPVSVLRRIAGSRMACWTPSLFEMSPETARGGNRAGPEARQGRCRFRLRTETAVWDRGARVRSVCGREKNPVERCTLRPQGGRSGPVDYPHAFHGTGAVSFA